MGSKRTSRRTKGSKIDSFNRSQQIYKLLEKGIIESEALASSAADRPEDDAHILELLEGNESERVASTSARRTSASRSKAKIKRSKPKPKKTARKKAIKRRKRR